MSTPQDTFATEVGSALIGFDIGRVVDIVKVESTIVTGTAGDMHVEPDALVQFYNDLSDLLTEIRTQMGKVHAKAVAAHEQNAGGLLPGAQKAWSALTEAAGAMAHENSLYGNLLSLSHLVENYMYKIQQSLTSYVENEGMAVVGLGKAMTGGAASSPVAAGAHTIGSAAATPASAGAVSVRRE